MTHLLTDFEYFYMMITSFIQRQNNLLGKIHDVFTFEISNAS